MIITLLSNWVTPQRKPFVQSFKKKKKINQWICIDLGFPYLACQTGTFCTHWVSCNVLLACAAIITFRIFTINKLSCGVEACCVQTLGVIYANVTLPLSTMCEILILEGRFLLYNCRIWLCRDRVYKQLQPHLCAPCLFSPSVFEYDLNVHAHEQ